MFRNIPRKIVFYLALSTAFLLLLVGLKQTPQVSAQGSAEYMITLRVWQNTDCSVGRYNVETPDGLTFESLRLKGVKTGGVQCSLIASGSVFGLGTTDVTVRGIGVFAGSLKLQKAEVEHDGPRIHVDTSVTGPRPTADGYPTQQQLILYLGN